MVAARAIYLQQAGELFISIDFTRWSIVNKQAARHV